MTYTHTRLNTHLSPYGSSDYKMRLRTDYDFVINLEVTTKHMGASQLYYKRDKGTYYSKTKVNSLFNTVFTLKITSKGGS